jgi:hypothetical protein
MKAEDYQRFTDLTFEDFRRMADDETLSPAERIGFPDTYRVGKEPAIFHDILQKVPNLSDENKIVLDIGPGCSELPRLIIDFCGTRNHRLLLVDSAEMLRHSPDRSFVNKFAGYYPKCDDLFNEYSERIDVIISYSVLHYVFAEGNIWEFLDRSLSLLAHGGEMLLGDVPNVSMRRRFFSSPSGVEFHKQFMNTDEDPEVIFNHIEHQQIDDSVVFSILMRARAQGFDSYLLPQGKSLPMANRREDILIRRP